LRAAVLLSRSARLALALLATSAYRFFLSGMNI
jgi:hypothetical protein